MNYDLCNCKNFFKPTKFFVYEDNFVRIDNKLYYNSTLVDEKNEFRRMHEILKQIKNNSDPGSVKSAEKARTKHTQKVILVHLYH